MENVEVIKRFLAPIPNGYGDGSGSGDGSGDGYGYGYGSGDGSGYGYGYGDGIKTYNWEHVWYIDDVPTLIESVHDYRYARGFIIRRDLTLEPTFVARVGNSFAHGETLHDALRDAEQKELEDMPLDERIDRFVKAYPDPDKPVPFRELYDWHHTLTGSCIQGRDNFVLEHGLNMDASYSVRYFIEITAHAYGGDAIRALAERYGIDWKEL